MVHSFGYRARTRDLFCRPHRKSGILRLTDNMIIYKVGDIVDVIANGAVQKGMPHKFYHGKTGRVYNVSKRAVGVIVNKQVKGRLEPKRINLRVEHIRKSQSREAFKKRVKANDKIKSEARKNGKVVSTKRQNDKPAESMVVQAKSAAKEFLHPLKYREVY